MTNLHAGTPPIVWTVDYSNGGISADLQADLHAFDAVGADGRIVRAAITALDSLAVSPVEPIAERLPQAQLDVYSDDRRPAAIKTGLPGSVTNLRALVCCVDRLRAADPLLALVVDPALQASTGADHADRALLDACLSELLPRATLITPNRAGAAALLGLASIDDDGDVEAAAHRLRDATGCHGVVITGGHDNRDFMLTEHAAGWLTPPHATARINDGIGSVFAATAAAALARGFDAADAVVLAKMASTQALRLGRPAGAEADSVPSPTGFAADRANLPGLLLPSTSGQSIGFAPLTEPQMGLYAVVDSSAWVRRVLDAGVRTVQLRIKDPAAPSLRDEIRRSVAAARAVHAQLFINDHWRIAIEEHAYGVHLGQEDLLDADLQRLADAGLRLGISTHAYWEVCRASALHPSYIACGPIHPTAAKAMSWIPQGDDNLGYWCALLDVPVVAIAGMDCDRAREAIRRGAASVAVISGITSAVSPEQAIHDFQQAIDSARDASRPPPPRLPRPTLARAA